MRKRDELPNPYALGVAEPDTVRSGPNLWLAGAVTAGVVVGGGLVLGGTALAGDASLGQQGGTGDADAPTSDPAPEPAQGTPVEEAPVVLEVPTAVETPDAAAPEVAAPEVAAPDALVQTPAEEPVVVPIMDVGDSGRKATVGRQEADKVVEDVTEQLDRDELGFEQRLAAIRVEVERRQALLDEPPAPAPDPTTPALVQAVDDPAPAVIVVSDPVVSDPAVSDPVVSDPIADDSIPVDSMPADPLPVGSLPVDSTPVYLAPVDPAPAYVPADPLPGDPALAYLGDPTPGVPTPADLAPGGDVSIEPVVVDPAPDPEPQVEAPEPVPGEADDPDLVLPAEEQTMPPVDEPPAADPVLPAPEQPAPGTPEAPSSLLDSVEQGLVEAEVAFRSFREPAGTGIIEFVRSVADLAVAVDAEPIPQPSPAPVPEPTTPAPEPSVADGNRSDQHHGKQWYLGQHRMAELRDEPVPGEILPADPSSGREQLVAEPDAPRLPDDAGPGLGVIVESGRAVGLPEPVVPAPVEEAAPAPVVQVDDSDLVGSPALTGFVGSRDWDGQDLLDWGARRADTMIADLTDSIDRLLDDLEISLFGAAHDDGPTVPAPAEVPLAPVTGPLPAPVVVADNEVPGTADR